LVIEETELLHIFIQADTDEQIEKGS